MITKGGLGNSLSLMNDYLATSYAEVKMKIGYTVLQDDIGKLKAAGATSIVLNDDLSDSCQQFIDFLKINEDCEILLVDIHSIGRFLSIIELFGIVEVVNERNNRIHFLNKGTDALLSDQEYLDFLRYIGNFEKRGISNRVRRGLKRSKERGVLIGRPSLEPETIKKIRRLKNDEKKTVREVAVLCNVSVGSVHKYTQ